MIVLFGIASALLYGWFAPELWLSHQFGWTPMALAVIISAYGVWQHERFHAAIVLPDSKSSNTMPVPMMPLLFVSAMALLCGLVTVRDVLLPVNDYCLMAAIVAAGMSLPFVIVFVLRNLRSNVAFIMQQRQREKGLVNG